MGGRWRAEGGAFVSAQCRQVERVLANHFSRAGWSEDEHQALVDRVNWAGLDAMGDVGQDALDLRLAHQLQGMPGVSEVLSGGWKLHDVQDMRVAVLCRNANGEPEFVWVLVRASRDVYERGEHYEIAEEVAQDRGYDPEFSFDEHDAAAGQLPELVKRFAQFGKPPEANGFKPCLVACLCEDSAGVPTFVVADVTLRREAYDDGDHYEECEGKAQDQRMRPMLSFDHVDVAAKQLPELAAFMGVA